uniref:RdRp n=1 Tax=Hubei picobirna-like virus 3 TaxID=1923086 RepID=A0A1L3KLQ9_9VIRU|nr:RdRp [Hubei picobirna-like virus 3]
MSSKLTAQQREVVTNNNGMARYLQSLQSGSDVTPRSWLYEDVSTDEVLAKWMQHLKSMEGKPTLDEVYQFELGALSKWGPQGAVEPFEELRSLIEETFKASSPLAAVKTEEWKQAKKLAMLELTKATGFKRLRPASYASVVDDMRSSDTLESNSAWPDFGRRNKPEMLKAALAAAKSGKWQEYPAIVLFRNYNKKTSPVWMFPMATNIVEGSFVQPVQQRLMKAQTPFFAPWIGFENVRKTVSQAYNDNWFIQASDFTKTDEHFTRHTTLEVYDVLKYCFQEGSWPALLQSMTHMNTISLVTGEDEIYHGEHGVSSGSTWTNFIETVFDLIFAYYVMLKLAHKHEGLYAIGDDMSWVSREFSPQFSEELETLGRDVNQMINADKTTNEKNQVKSLQRLFIRGFTVPETNLVSGIYPTVSALKSAVFPEKFHNPKLWNKDMFAASIFMILENCVDHPLFNEFVQFVVRGNSYLAEFARLKALTLTNVTSATKLLPGFNPTYNQEKSDKSLADFESMSIASEL